LLLLGLSVLVLHALTNGQYGFHRDELATLDDARFPAWGYVAYPPLTPLVAAGALHLFGPSLVGLRFFSALAQALVLVLAGLMARELGGSRRAQVLAALGAAIAPVTLVQGALFQYVGFDYLWWVLATFCLIRLLKTEDVRWWLPIGAVVGVGLLTKYTMAFWAVSMALALLITPVRRYLSSPWLWAGAGLAFILVLPHLVWQAQHGFVALEYLQSIHSRDVRIGRTAGFLPEQLYVSASLVTVPLWGAGLYFYFVAAAGRRFRMLGWMYVILIGLFVVSEGRSYYTAPAYPMLIAAGSVVWERWVDALPALWSRFVQGVTWTLLAVGGAFGVAVMLPVAPVNSGLWQVASALHDNFIEEIGWPELAETVAGAYHTLPADQRATAGILAGNPGVAGALNLYGPAHGLPPVISGANSYWLRGYGSPPPRPLVLTGFRLDMADQLFTGCEVVGQIRNSYGIANEETRFRRDVLRCQEPREPWPALWAQLRTFS
jgi:4-amino-4-deoxy-L-arabinose transferase-like glycosyltransferase